MKIFIATILIYLNIFSVKAESRRLRDALNLPQIDTNCKKQYIKRIIGDTGIFSPMIIIKVSDPKGERTVIANNAILFHYLNSSYGYDFKMYKDKIFSLLFFSKPLRFEQVTNESFMAVVDTNSYAHQLLKKGGFALVKNNFLLNSYTYNIDKEGWLAALAIFFDNNYIIRRGDIGGGMDVHEFECKTGNNR